MCFELDSSPPIPVISGAAVSHDDLVLEARDGNRFAAFLAAPEEPSAKGVVILPDVRGLYRFYEELALRFAERGYPALAFDYFGRTAGIEKRGKEFVYRPHVEAVTQEQIQADVAAAVEHVRSLGVESVFTVGFCMGGRQSWLAAADGHGLAGAVGFYGRPGESWTGSPARRSWPRRSRRRSSPCRPELTRTSRPRTTKPSSRRSRTRASSTSSSSTTARRTASSTASRTSSRAPPRTPGTGTLEFIEHHGR